MKIPVAGTVTYEVAELIERDVQRRNCCTSDIVRKALEKYYAEELKAESFKPASDVLEIDYSK